VSLPASNRLRRATRDRGALIAATALWVVVPLVLTDRWLYTLEFAAVLALGGIGLNLLTGFTGQVSLGQAAFVGVGAYVTAWFGVQQELSMATWLPLAALAGALVGALVGPFALRLRGEHLVVVTLGLLFVGEHLWNNWEGVTGGGFGTSTAAPLDLGSLRFEHLRLFGETYSRDQGSFWLVWGVVGIGALLAGNLVRSRTGRAMQAVRDRDVAAEVLGISAARYKIGAFACAGAYGAVAGALFGALQQFVDPSQFGGVRGLFLSIQFVAVIVIGGLGSVSGGIAGAVVIASSQLLIRDYGQHIPIAGWHVGGQALLPAEVFDQVVYGLLIIGFLLFEPKGMAGLARRARSVFQPRGARS
jgi:branched-chain amino acid transport system permease protein